MNAPGDPVAPVARLTELADYIVPFTLRAVCDIGVADQLADGPRTVAELARRTGTHAPSLLRALRALAGRGVFTEVAPETFGLTPLAEPLRTDHPRSLRAAYPLLAGDVQAWAVFDHTLRTGAPAFVHAHGVDYWTYLAGHPRDSARFDASQQAVTQREVRALIPGYDWARFGTVVDVGGGNGAFVAALAAAFPAMRGVVFDQPHVVSGAGAVFAAAGVSDRCTAVGGDFRTSVPAGADAYVVKRALYDLDDDAAAAMLAAIRSGIAPDGRLLVIEPMVEPGDGFDWGKLYDVLLLAMRGTGSRTREQLEDLFAKTGFALTEVVRTKALPVIEARPV
jgi:hypothetical protein